MADVVPVADIGQPVSPQRAEFFFQREIIRQRLARMKTVGERIDDRNLSVRRQLFENGLVVDARDDAVHPPLEIPRHVHDGLALAEPRRLRMVQENRRCAPASHSRSAFRAWAERRFSWTIRRRRGSASARRSATWRGSLGAGYAASSRGSMSIPV